jgi:hypothetical protein
VPPSRTANAERPLLADAARPPTTTVQQASPDAHKRAQERPLIADEGMRSALHAPISADGFSRASYDGAWQRVLYPRCTPDRSSYELAPQPVRQILDHPAQVRQGEHPVEDVRGRAASAADATLRRALDVAPLAGHQTLSSRSYSAGPWSSPQTASGETSTGMPRRCHAMAPPRGRCAPYPDDRVQLWLPGTA